mmetsp:Transcript_125783/g.245270  ORF Transcript_125783/g.245270 Transcript_125783/m.245270 type:complete len:212 (-) Transcript_125783:47-682(-)
MAQRPVLCRQKTGNRRYRRKTLPRKLDFVDAKKWWKKLGPLYRSNAAREIWLPFMACVLKADLCDGRKMRKQLFTVKDVLKSKVHARLLKEKCQRRGLQSFKDLKPYHFCQWGGPMAKGGRPPAYEEFICPGSCHYFVRLHHWVMQQIEPNAGWVSVMGSKHSTVWDGGNRVYDPAWQWLGFTARHALTSAWPGRAICWLESETEKTTAKR